MGGRDDLFWWLDTIVYYSCLRASIGVYCTMSTKSWPLSSLKMKKLCAEPLENPESSKIYCSGEQTNASQVDLVELKDEVYRLVRRFHCSMEKSILLDRIPREKPKLKGVIQIVDKVEQQMVVESAEAYEPTDASKKGSSGQY